MRRTTRSVAPASAMETTRPTRTPLRTPWVTISRPPSVGAISTGTRRRIAWTEKPTARRSRGSASPTTAKRVGLAMLVQHITNSRPSSTTGQAGAAATTAYPTAARPTKSSIARRRPKRSPTQPPGYWYNPSSRSSVLP